MTTVLIAGLAGLMCRIGTRDFGPLRRAQGFLAALVLASLPDDDEGPDHVAAQREAAPWQ